MDTKPERVTQRGDSLVINADGMSNAQDHREVDVGVNRREYEMLRDMQARTGDLIGGAILAGAPDRDQRGVKKGKNLFALNEGEFGQNPDDEKDRRQEKLERLVDGIFERLNFGGGKIPDLFKGEWPPELREIKPLLQDFMSRDGGTRFSGRIGTVSQEECKKLRLSFSSADKDSRWNFILDLIYLLDRRLRCELLNATSTGKYPRVEHNKLDKDGDPRCEGRGISLHPSFSYSIDEKGLSVFMDLNRLTFYTEKDSTLETTLYKDTEQIQLRFGTGKSEIDVNARLKDEARERRRDYKTA
jgi:hypothetical protein